MLPRLAMDNPQLKARTFNAAIRVVHLVESLPNGPRAWTIGRQLLDSGTSQAAQYRAACRAQSTRDFISKMKKMEEEADESAFWLGILRVAGVARDLRAEVQSLEEEFDELTRIALSSAQTARLRLSTSRSK
jgi:four helix bundle protein